MITGYFCLTPHAINLPQLANKLRAVPLANIPFSQQVSWHNTQCLLLEQEPLSAQAENLINPTVFQHTESNTLIVAWARIDNRSELTQALPQHLADIGSSPQALILASYLHWGERCCEYLIGDFAFAIYDARQQHCFLGRDHTGVRPLYYYQDSERLIFASSLAIFDNIPNIDLTLNQAWLARYLIGRSHDWQTTVFNNIKKVPPAHYVLVKQGQNNVIEQRYFEFSASSDLLLNNTEEYVEAYRETLEKAVHCRIQNTGLIGSELSGGLDSSSITAIAAKKLPHAATRLHTFGMANHEMEPDCIMAISQSVPTAMTHLITQTQGFHAPYSQFYDTYGAPEEHSNGIGHFPFYRMCEKLGIHTLLSGFGGDEFVTSAAPTAMVEFWKNQNWGLFLSRQRGNWLTKPMHTARWLYHYYRHQNQSITSQRLQKSGRLSWPLNPVNTQTSEQYDLHKRFHQPLQYDGGQLTQNDFALNNRWSPVMTARYENCTLAAARYGVDYHWPLMDIRLLTLFLSIPASEKLGPNGVGRYLHRRAVSHILPQNITWKSKDMISVNLFKKLLFGDRYLYALARLTQGNKTTAPTQAHSSHTQEAMICTSIPEQHSEIESLIDQNKLATLFHTAQDPNSSQQQKSLCNQHISRLNELNRWLKHHQLRKTENS